MTSHPPSTTDAFPIFAPDLGPRRWDVVVATYGRIRYLAEALANRTGHFVSVSGAPVIGASVGVPTTEDTPYEAAENAPAGLRGILPRIAATERARPKAGEPAAYRASLDRTPHLYGPHAVAPPDWP